MSNSPFYNLRSISFVDRESFNSAILLLSLVKSSCYYIVGFSRPGNYIDIAFDYSSSLHGKITETMRMEFCRTPADVVISSRLSNIPAEHFSEEAACETVGKGHVFCEDDAVVYELLMPKHSVIPSSGEQLHSSILLAKGEICDFIEGCLTRLLED